MTISLVGGTILTPLEQLAGHTLIIKGDDISAIIPDHRNEETDTQRIDASGLWVTPGLIDIHTHGANGHDTMDATPEALDGLAEFLARHGVTSYLPTTITATRQNIQSAIDNIERHVPLAKGARVAGIHLEGPYLNPAHRGAQPEALIRKADPDEFMAWIEHDLVKLMTVAPEVYGVLDLIEAGQQHGLEFAVGHSGATYDVMQAAADRGLRQATHTFNGMLGIHHRRPGTAGSVLTDDRIYAQVIADGVHLHPAIIQLIVKAKGISKTILISDSMRATGLVDGEYDLGGQRVRVERSIARIPSGSLAGSTLTLNAAIRNIMDFTSLSFKEVLPMATSVPAEAMGWHGKVGVLKPGATADVVCFDAEIVPRMVFVAGELIYKNN
ncbi:MAG: N-acetylglucosamine-6-phosphate deacetylase [Anaerolineales bacterium]|nr:N-acetylglucosamine-6-phosphate deacetylase [Anaerolineales bacterium]